MKIKWLTVLFIFFLAVILLSLAIVQESQKAAFLPENEILITKQAESSAALVYPPQARPALVAALPVGNSGITIIKAPAITPEEKNINVAETADKAANNVFSQNIASSRQTQDLPQAGTTAIKKRPTLKETQEMNSSGIVMY